MMRSYKLKIWIYMACLTSSLAAPAPQPVPLVLDIIDLAAISRMSPQQLEVLAEGLAAQEIMRTKRSSAQALTSVISKTSSGLAGKLGLLGQASAGASSFISSASSKSEDEHGYSYEPHESHDTKVDFWGLKKSILYTLFQAVKAITGGVTILKGQLIKGGGALATTLGKVIKVKGEAVSNLGKKIVTSAALSPPKKHHASAHAPVYGPPPLVHAEYAPTAYGPPSAPSHYVGPSAPTGYSSHKYPAHLDGRGPLSGVHAGLILLTPVGADSQKEVHQHIQHSPSEPAHTPLEPPPSIIHSVFSAIKDVFSPATPTEHISHESHDISHDSHDIPHDLSHDAQELEYHPPPPIAQHVPEFKPMSWGAVNSYGEPAIVDTYPNYDPRHPTPPFNVHASAKKSVAPKKQHSLSPEKIQKIRHNINKALRFHESQLHQRSSEDLPTIDPLDVYRKMVEGNLPLAPTQVVTDADIGVLSAEMQPSQETEKNSVISSTSSPESTTEVPRRKKDVKFVLRGNRIVQV